MLGALEVRSSSTPKTAKFSKANSRIADGGVNGFIRRESGCAQHLCLPGCSEAAWMRIFGIKKEVAVDQPRAGAQQFACARQDGGLLRESAQIVQRLQ